MGDDRSRMRLDVWCEDQLQSMFLRRLLIQIGFDGRRLEFHIAPKAAGSAERWVLSNYPSAVSRLRSKSYQRHLGLLAMRDGDRDGFEVRQAQMDAQLARYGIASRAPGERIALPFPQWCVESWLLVLLGHEAAEAKADKQAFAGRVGRGVAAAVAQAVRAWGGQPAPTVSMLKAETELQRL